MNTTIIFFLFIFISFNFVTSENDDDSCKWLYRCCKKVSGSCAELCEPVIICEESTTYHEKEISQKEETTQEKEEITQEKSTELPQESPTFQNIASQTVIAVQCRKGFKPDTNRKCRRVLK